MLLCLLATAQAATPTRTTPAAAKPQLLPTEAWDRIRTGRVHVERDFIDATLAQRLRADATLLQERGLFRPDGLSRLGEARERQGFNRGDRQTYAGGWEASEGDSAARRLLAAKLAALRREAALALRRPSMGRAGAVADERSYNWYEPGASLRRHGDEFHEETKGPKGWLLPTRRSLTWLLYLNRDWRADEGGALRAYERARPCDHAVGATDDGDVQVGWVGEDREVPVFLGEDVHGERVLYDATGQIRGGCAAGVAAPPLTKIADAGVRLIRGSLDRNEPPPPGEVAREIQPVAGTLLLFDSVAVPHEVLAVTAERPRVACTGWFHELLPAP